MYFKRIRLLLLRRYLARLRRGVKAPGQCPAFACAGLVLLYSASLVAQSPFAPKVTGPLSQRVVAYQIDATYDPVQHAVDATETLTYRNLTGQPLSRFPFHLYLNAFQPKS